MKVWEKIKIEAEKQNYKLDTLEKVRDWMYAYRCIPCDMNDEFKIINKETMSILCEEFEADCYSCLCKYLELDIT